MIDFYRKQFLVSQLRFIYEGSKNALSGQVFDPPLVAEYDIISLQKTAKEIAEFIGLKEITPIVNFSDFTENVGGEIDLSNPEKKEVYIEIDRELVGRPDSVHCILSHELAHKWLQLLSLESTETSTNEIRTDLATIILGLGKLMLNGCKTTASRRVFSPEGTQVHSSTHVLGYLTLEEFAYSYSIVCRLQSLDQGKIFSHLRPEAERALSNWSAFSFDFKNEDEAESIRSYRNEERKFQIQLNELGKRLYFLRNAVLGRTESVWKKAHEQRAKDLTTFGPDIDSYLSEYLNCPFATADKIAQIQDSFAATLQLKEEAEKAIEEARFISDLIATSFRINALENHDLSNKVTCPCCEKNLRLPKTIKAADVTCPRCKYKFFYDSQPIVFRRTSIRKFRKQAKKAKIFDRIQAALSKGGQRTL